MVRTAMAAALDSAASAAIAGCRRVASGRRGGTGAGGGRLVLGQADPGQWKSRTLVEPCSSDSSSPEGRASPQNCRGRAAAGAGGLRPAIRPGAALADRAAELAQTASGLTVEALGPAEIAELGMGAFAAVAQGSYNEPRLIDVKSGAARMLVAEEGDLLE
jgi:leucyl aminopeptidase